MSGEHAGRSLGLIDEAYRTNRIIRVCATYRKTQSPAREKGYWEEFYVPLGADHGRAEGVLVFSKEITDEVVARRRAEAIADFAMELNAGTSLSPKLTTALARAIELLGGDGGLLYLCGQEEPRLHQAMAFGRAEGMCSSVEAAEFPTIRRMLEPGRPAHITVEDLTDAEIERVKHPGWSSCLAAPLAAGGRRVGVVLVGFVEPGHEPVVEDMDFAEVVAKQSALAIEWNRLYEERAGMLEREHTAGTQAQEYAMRLSALLENLDEGALVCDKDGSIVLQNASFEETSGVRRGSASHFADFAAHCTLLERDGTTVPVEKWPISRLLRGERVSDEEYMIQRSDGTRRHVALNGGATCDATGVPTSAILTCRDVTRLHELEQAKDDYLRLLTHELRSPLALLMGYAQIAERSADNPDRVKAASAGIIRAVRHMDVLISDLADSMRLESGQLRLAKGRVNLRDLLSRVLEEAAHTMRVDRIKVRAPQDLPDVLADRDRLARILINLLSNASKYSSPGTVITVTITQSDSFVVTSVSNEGPPIPPEDFPHVFERYYRGRAATGQSEGLGLGLYVAKGLVEAHGGQIWASSEPDTGTTFSFSLPKYQD
jgi:signal transduction histidine kinase